MSPTIHQQSHQMCMSGNTLKLQLGNNAHCAHHTHVHTTHMYTHTHMYTSTHVHTHTHTHTLPTIPNCNGSVNQYARKQIAHATQTRADTHTHTHTYTPNHSQLQWFCQSVRKETNSTCHTDTDMCRHTHTHTHKHTHIHTHMYTCATHKCNLENWHLHVPHTAHTKGFKEVTSSSCGCTQPTSIAIRSPYNRCEVLALPFTSHDFLHLPPPPPLPPQPSSSLPLSPVGVGHWRRS